MNNTIFLLCSERSGSNFITKLMNRHSRICGPSPKHLINPVARNYFRYQPLGLRENWEILVNDILNLFNVKFSIWKASYTREELLNEVKYGDLSGLLSYFFRKETECNQKEFCFIKEIKTYEFYPFLKVFFKDSKYLHQVRDPRDMALSWKKSKIHRGGIIQAAKQWKKDQQEYLKIIELENLTNSIVSIRYEDLVSNSESILRKVMKELGLEYEPEMLDMSKDVLTAKNSKTQKAWENLSKPVIKNNFDKYKEELTENEIMLIESICYFEMNHFGYETNFSWDKLKNISSTDLNNFNLNELKNLAYEPVDGVLDNMRAKQRFYQHLQ